MEQTSASVPEGGRPDGLARFAWGVVVYVLAVIVWGAYVRASGSGAGCGDHWPLCNGVVVPRAPSVQTLIELTHRVTSSLAGLLSIVLCVWAFRARRRGDPVRPWAAWQLVLMIVEGLLGAALVRFQLVADNPSAARAVAMSAHLANTLLLLGALGATAQLARRPRTFDVAKTVRGGAWLGPVLLGMLITGMSGAIAALGDTLFPSRSLGEALAQDFSPTAHFLLRLRTLHPIFAIGAGLLALLAVARLRRDPLTPTGARLASLTTSLVAIQWILGVVNVVLLAPIWMQLLHLLVADLLWLALVAFGVESCTVEQRRADAAEPSPRARELPAASTGA